MSACPPDPEGAAWLAEAMKGHSQKELAAQADVQQSVVSKWLRVGNVPRGQLRRLPPDVRRRYSEQQAAADGALVLRREMLDSFFSLVGWSPLPLKDSCEATGSMAGRRERSVA
jgi:hypothetical protein